MENGKLKIYFGYSAGVGKTYAMLKAAQELKQEGVDVAIGYLEPHERAETTAMAQGLRRLPLKEITYKGIALKEFDVDYAVAVRPGLILVDELAHTNVQGSKNRKRYMDVEELIKNGINVWTTVNVQHLEGLHDIVDSATSVDVNERIPDEIFDYADEVVLIDIETADLIERMREGKIYKKALAKTALENFFNTDNLSSLRELFMRRGADRIEKLFHNGELDSKVLVLISPSPSSEKNIRVAARMAEAYHCKFSAMYVERDGELSDEAAQILKKHMRLVRDLCGKMIVKYGEDVVETVADYIRLSAVTHLVMGKTWQSVGKKMGLEDKFIVRIPEVEILIVPDNYRFSYRSNPIKKFFAPLFMPKILMQKYRSSNKTLDIIDLVAQAAFEAEPEYATAQVLSVAFERSCIVYGQKTGAAAFRNEDIGFFGDAKESAVADWCKKNKKTAGRGTDTLRGANAIYFPITAKRSAAVIAFSCAASKMSITDKLMFSQIESVLKVVL